MASVRPIFLFSLPRSGSTLVQRVLASHPAITTTAEPWVLLPALYALRAEGARAEYGHVPAAEALWDFCNRLPHGRRDYLSGVHDFVSALYAGVAEEGATYFLDKTPHYHLIAEEIAALFPEAKLLFLWRNPLSVVASCMETFCGGEWEPYHFRVDLFDGVTNLVDTWRAESHRAHAVRYEDLLVDPTQWARVFEYLELDFDPGVLTRFSNLQLEGRYGDQTGSRAYGELSREPLTKWRETVSSRVRREWCRRYLRALGRERLTVMGYQFERLVGELDRTLVTPGAARDVKHLATSFARDAIKAEALRMSEMPRPRGPAFVNPPRLSARLAKRLRRILP